MISGGETPTVVVRTANFSCHTKIGPSDFISTERPVSVDVKAGEKPGETRARLEEAARALAEKGLTGCYRARFTHLQPTPEEVAASLKPAKAESLSPKLASNAGAPDRCAGDWQNRPVCKW